MGWRPGQGIGPRITKREKTRTRQKNEKLKIYGCSLPHQDNDEEMDSEDSGDNDEEILFAPDDWEPFRCNPKDNYFGIGYEGLDRRPVLSSGHVNLFEAPTSFNLQEKNKKFSIRGQAFGVGAFEADDEDIYQRDDMSRYDFALEPESKSGHKSRWSKTQNESTRENCIDNFVPATRKLERKKVYEAPELPKGFQPRHVVRKSRFYPPIEPIVDSGRKKGFARPDLSATDRAIIIGEPTAQNSETSPSLENHPIAASPEKVSVASNIIIKTLNLHGREQTENRKLQDSLTKTTSAGWLDKLGSKNFISGGIEGSSSGATGSLKNFKDFKTEMSDSRAVKPFVMDPEKQVRFEKFIEFMRKGENDKLASLQPLSLTEWERQREKDEFEQAARIFEGTLTSRDKSSSDARDKFVGSGAQQMAAASQPMTPDEQMKNAAKMKLFGKLTRERETWQPASIVCKRFNIPEPRTGCANPDKSTKSKKFSVFDSLEFSGVSERFEGATDTAGTFEEPHIPYVEKKNADNEGTAASSRIFDDTDIDDNPSVESKMRSFEASYEKIFGLGGSSSCPIIEKPADTNVREQRASSAMESEEEPKSVDSKENSAEKKDLFKAIFLSSSEDSESDNDEDDTEAVKSLLIGKMPGQVNVQRNTSPPRGIFANLDLESLAKPGEDKSPSRVGKTTTEDVHEKKDNNDPNNGENKVSSPQDVEILPDMYGPVLPARIVRTGENLAKDDPSTTSRDVELSRPIFKSVVVTKNNANYIEKSKGQWVERDKVKKSKKSKHKHKHKEKERSRHKHKSNKKDRR